MRKYTSGRTRVFVTLQSPCPHKASHWIFHSFVLLLPSVTRNYFALWFTLVQLSRRELSTMREWMLRSGCINAQPRQHTSPRPSPSPLLGTERGDSGCFIHGLSARPSLGTVWAMWNSLKIPDKTQWNCRNIRVSYRPWLMAGRCPRLDNDPRGLPTQSHHYSTYYPRTVHVLNSRITDPTPHSPTSSKPFQKY